MKKYLLIAVSVLLVIGSIVGIIITNHSNKNKLCKSINIIIKNADEEQFLSENEITDYLIKNTDSIIGRKISEININLLENVLLKNSYILNAEVFCELNGNVKIQIVERKPVVRIFNYLNQQFYLDEVGVKIPIKENSPFNVIIANGNIKSLYVPFNPLNEKQRHDTIEIMKDSVLNSVYKVAKYISTDTFLKSQIVEIYVNNENEIELFTQLGEQEIIFGDAENIENKFNKLLILYKEGFNKFGWDKYQYINLKYKNQVICSKKL